MEYEAFSSGPKTRISTIGIVRITVLVVLLIMGLTLFTVKTQSHIATLEQEMAQREKIIAELSAQLEFAPSVILIVPEDALGCGMPGTPMELRDIFNEMGGRYGIEPTLLAAIAKHESGFNTDALSPAGAMGLMGLMPITIEHLKLKYNLEVDPWDPKSAVEGASAYLQELQRRFNGEQVLAAYNLGPTRLRRLDGDFSGIQETTQYVEKIHDSLRGSLPASSMP